MATRRGYWEVLSPCRTWGYLWAWEAKERPGDERVAEGWASEHITTLSDVPPALCRGTFLLSGLITMDGFTLSHVSCHMEIFSGALDTT